MPIRSLSHPSLPRSLPRSLTHATLLQAGTIALSFLLFPKPFSMLYVYGTLLVLGGLTAYSYVKEGRKAAKRRPHDPARPDPPPAPHSPPHHVALQHAPSGHADAHAPPRA